MVRAAAVVEGRQVRIALPPPAAPASHWPSHRRRVGCVRAPAEHLQAQPVHEDDDGSRAATGFPGFADQLDPPAAGNHAGPGVGDDRFNVEAEVGIAVVPGVGQGNPALTAPTART